MSRKIFLPRPEERNFSCLPAPVRYARCSVVLSCPFVLGFLQLFHLGSCIFISSDDADQSLKLSKPCGCACQPWIYLIYKRECQGKYSSLDRKRGTFLAFQPLSAMRDARLCCLAPLSLGSCNCSISAAASLLVATTPISL